MHTKLILSWLILVSSFDVVSVKPSSNLVGPDYNNQLTFSPSGITGKNVTLERLIAEAYHLQLNQVLGPNWLDRNEYEIEAKSGQSVGRDQLALMLQTLLAERFNLRQHRETRSLKVYQLVTEKAGPKIRPVKDGSLSKPAAGFHFRGDLRQFADLLAVQLSIPESSDPDPTRPQTSAGPPIPVLDKTGLVGTYDFNVDLKPEFGTSVFTVWQRVLQEQLGLRMESIKGKVPVIIVDSALQVPTPN